MSTTTKRTRAKRAQTKSAHVRARVTPDVKARAEKIMVQLGLTPTAAITMFYQLIINNHGLPFAPNATTLAAMQDIESGDVIHAKSIDDLFDKLDGND